MMWVMWVELSDWFERYEMRLMRVEEEFDSIVGVSYWKGGRCSWYKAGRHSYICFDVCFEWADAAFEVLSCEVEVVSLELRDELLKLLNCVVDARLQAAQLTAPLPILIVDWAVLCDGYSEDAVLLPFGLEEGSVVVGNDDDRVVLWLLFHCDSYFDSF